MRLVYPVGQYAGAIREAEGAVFKVRRGESTWTIDAAASLLWLDAHGLAGIEDGTPWTRAAVLAVHAAEMWPAGAAERYTTLRETRLIVEIDPDAPEAIEFAQCHQLLPKAIGLGNRPDDPDRFRVGFPPNLQVAVPRRVWRLWRESHLEPTLWDGCVARVGKERALGIDVGPRELLVDTLRSLHILLGIQLAYLDVPS
jgi:hypothetical protein